MRSFQGLLALGAVFALAGSACNSSSRGNAKAKAQAGTAAVAAGTAGSLSVTMAPAAPTGGTFSADVALRNSTGALLDASDVVTLTLASSPVAGATLGGTLSKAAVHGVASFSDLTVSASGSGYVLGASSSQATVAAPAAQSAPFRVAYSEDDQPGNTSTGSAQAISPGVPVFGALGAGEVHYYKFAAKAGQVVEVASYANRLDLGNWDTSLRVRLIGPDGSTELARGGAIGPDANSVDTGLTAYIPAAGTYYFACDQDQGGFASGKFGVSFSFRAAPDGVFQTEAEPAGTTGQNDTAATAEPLLPGVLYGHYDSAASGAAAPDFYKISIGGPTRVHLELNAARAGAAGGGKAWDGALAMHDAGGNVLWRSDNALFLDPAVDYVFTAAATYYVRVTRAEYAANAGPSPYFLSYSATSYAPQDVAGSAAAAGAVAVAYGADISGSFSAGGTQFYSFNGSAGDVVRVTLADKGELQGATEVADSNTVPNTVTPSGPTNGGIASPGGAQSGVPGMAVVEGQTAGAPVLLEPDPDAARPSTTPNGLDATLLAGDGTTALAAGVGAGNATDNRLNTRQTILQATGRYVVRVTSPLAGTYAFRIDKLAGTAPEVEPNETAAAATAVGSNGWASGVISSGTDKDHFKVHAEQGQLLTVGLLGAAGGGIGTLSADWGSSLVPVVEVRDAAGNVLARAAADRKGQTNFAESMAHPEAALEASFRAPAAGDYDIAVQDADAQGGAKYFYALHAWKNESAPFAAAGGAGSVSGTVTNVQTGSAIAGATVSWPGGSTLSDAFGNYSLGGLPAGTVTITGDSNGYLGRSYSVTVTPGGTAARPVQLSTSGKLVGNVTGDGSPLTTATVQVSGGQIPTVTTDGTDSTGHYDEGWVPIGTYQVTCSAPGFPSQTLAGAAVTTGNTTTVNCALSSTGTVTGKVTNVQTGGAISGATVAWSGGSALSDASGNYTLTGVAAGPVTLTGSAGGYLERSFSTTVNAGATTAFNVQLSTSGKIVGNVTHAGAALAGVTVTAKGGQIAASGSDTTDAAGHYDDGWLPIGNYTVTCSKSGFTTQSVGATVTTGGTATVNCAL